MTSPTNAGQPRIEVADVLRGLAVAGIILLHSIEHFNFYSFPPTEGQSQWLNFTDKAIWDSLFFLLGGKAYAIFALLFGVSFYIQDNNQRLRGNDFRLRFAWRLVLLFAIGNINAIFFTGEILVMYSLVGFILIPLCRVNTRLLLWIAAILMLQPMALYFLIRAIADPSYVAPAINSAPFWKDAFAVQSAGNFIDTAKVNLWQGQLASLAWAWEHGRIFQTAALFILGMLIGRHGWLRGQYTGQWAKVAIVGLCAFFPLYGLSGMLPEFIASKGVLSPLNIIVTSLRNVAFAAVLVAGVIYLYYRTGCKSALSRITPYGRMSMTCYVTQSIAGSWIYYNWGLGMHAHMGITASFLLGILLFALQYAVCVWWMRHFSRGPLESVWRRATWIKIPALA